MRCIDWRDSSGEDLSMVAEDAWFAAPLLGRVDVAVAGLLGAVRAARDRSRRPDIVGGVLEKGMEKRFKNRGAVLREGGKAKIEVRTRLRSGTVKEDQEQTGCKISGYSSLAVAREARLVLPPTRSWHLAG